MSVVHGHGHGDEKGQSQNQNQTPTSDHAMTVPDAEYYTSAHIGPTDNTHRHTRPMASSSSAVSRSPPKSAPPSAPLPPLPKGALSPYHGLGLSPSARMTLTSSNTRTSRPSEDVMTATATATATADILKKPGVRSVHPSSPLFFFSLLADRKAVSPLLTTSASQPNPLNPSWGRTSETQDKDQKDESVMKALPTPPTRSRDRAADPAPPPPVPPPKSGLLKRLTTRLAGTRSSPSLRPPAAIPEEALKTHRLETPEEEQEEHEKPVRQVPPVPARPVPPIPEDNPKPPIKVHQSLNSRLNLAALAEKRAEKREARAREEQRATNARRAAALAQTGLLPASRRYSVVPASYNAQPSSFDPFAKDRIQHDKGSDDGIIVEEGTSGQEKNQEEGVLSAAEVVIREWRERNARANEARNVGPQTRVVEDTQNESQGTSNSSVRDRDNPSSPSTSSPGLAIASSTQTPCLLPKIDVSECQEGATDQHLTSPSSSEIPVPAGTSSGNTASGSDPPKVDHGDFSLAPPPPPKKSRSAKTETVPNPNEEESDRDNKVSGSAEGEKTTLSKWRFPTTTSHSVLDLSSEPTQRVEKIVDDLSSPASPESGSSVATAVVTVDKNSRLDEALTPKEAASEERDEPSQADTPSESAPRAMLSPSQTPLPKAASEERDEISQADTRSESAPRAMLSPSLTPLPKAPSEERDETSQADTRSDSAPREMLSPSQIPLPPSPGPRVPPSPRSRNRAATAPPAPAHRSRSQIPPSGLAGSAQALAVSLPALSPTTSTSTSTSGGSTLLRTPSTSSHGHSPVRVLDAPLEDEEDTLLSNAHTPLASITESKSEMKVTGVREFGQLAKLADVESERSDCGALPPFPPSSSQETPFGTAATPVAEDDRRKRTTLFGRRRTTQNDPPMISIPESFSSVGKGLGAGASQNKDTRAKQPLQHASSFTNLRRTVASVATGLAGAAGATIRSRDRSPLRGASTPLPRPPPPPVSPRPRSNTSGVNSLSPSNAEFLTPNRCTPGVGLRPRPLNPTIHSRGSILMETFAIEDAESRRLAELAFLD